MIPDSLDLNLDPFSAPSSGLFRRNRLGWGLAQCAFRLIPSLLGFAKLTVHREDKTDFAMDARLFDPVRAPKLSQRCQRLLVSVYGCFVLPSQFQHIGQALKQPG